MDNELAVPRREARGKPVWGLGLRLLAGIGLAVVAVGTGLVVWWLWRSDGQASATATMPPSHWKAPTTAAAGSAGTLSAGSAGSLSTGSPGSFSTGSAGSLSAGSAGSLSAGSAGSLSTGSAGSPSTGSAGSLSAGSAGSASIATTPSTDASDSAATPDALAEPSPIARESRPDSEMVRIPGGTFPMGRSDGNPNEKPVHSVTVPTFELDRTEVTVAAYAGCMSASACTEPNSYQSGYRKSNVFCNWQHPEDRATHPINCVDWDQATAYCRWLEKRLPTEEEWEYAARRGGGQYPWGDMPPNETLTNVCGPECVRGAAEKGFPGWKAISKTDDGWVETAPVGSFPAGASRDGVQDLIGNVWEWTASGYSINYKENPDNSYRVARGRGWNSTVASGLHPAARSRFEPNSRYIFLGFRCAR